MRNKKTVGCLASVAISLSAVSFASETQSLMLDELISKIGSNPQVRAQNATVDAREARLQIIETRSLPRLQFSGDGDLLSTAQEQRSITVSAEKTLYDWGSLNSDLESARYGLQTERQRVSATELALRQQVVSAYLAAWSAKQRIEASSDAIKTAKNLREVMQRRVDQRVDPASDLLLIESRLGQLEAGVIQLKGAQRDAQLNLLQLVDHKADLNTPLSCSTELDEAQLAKQAVENSPELAAAKFRALGISAEFGAVDAKRLPAIVAGVALTRDVDDSDNDARAYLSVRYNFDLGGSLDAELAELNAEYSAARFDEERTAQAIVREAAGLVNQYQQNSAQIPLLVSMVELRQEQLDSYSRRFSSGMSSLLDLLTAESELLDARTAEIDAVVNSCFAVLTLEQLVGRVLRD